MASVKKCTYVYKSGRVCEQKYTSCDDSEFCKYCHKDVHKDVITSLKNIHSIIDKSKTICGYGMHCTIKNLDEDLKFWTGFEFKSTKSKDYKSIIKILDDNKISYEIGNYYEEKMVYYIDIELKKIDTTLKVI
jgi:hypothetical protein